MKGSGYAGKNLLARTLRAVVPVMVVFAAGAASADTQQITPAQQMAQDTIARWPEGRFTPPEAKWQWNYELGTLLDGMDAMWYNSADRTYYQYIKQSVDQFVTPDGRILTYDPSAYSLDNVLLGRQLLLLYRVTQDKKYYTAATALRQQLVSQPTNASGGFWHKQIYPEQMWLDGLYMAEPFFAEYASVSQQTQDFAEITKQFVLVEQHMRDPETGLLYHGWDESKQQSWANKTTGNSSSFWARGMGWYMMALVDSLPYYPESDPGRAQLLAILNRTAEAVARYQDPETGLWYQVLDKPGVQGNYFESSASCMFTYALARGVRLGYLPQRYAENAARSWQGIQKQFVQKNSDGTLTLTGTVKAIGLGGAYHRDGSYSYYVSSPVVSNDPKGIGAYLLAGSEMELAGIAQTGAHRKVLLDAWYNSQKRQNAAGVTEYFHYKWDDYSNPGFSLFGHIFRSYGIATDTIYTAPTLAKLKDAQYYIIVSPDNQAKNPDPHYMTSADAKQIVEWVRRGGVLLMMENDPANADIPHMNLLADKFGLHFNNVLVHHVIGDRHEMGRMDVPAGGPLFHHPHVLFMKDTCSLSPSKDAISLLEDKGETLMAYTKYGKGTVYAVTDPWLYNEYTDGRNLSPDYDNFGGGMELVRWLVQQHESVAR
jgi:unsaturated rhamnogalacturonyl hydrolase